MTWWLDQSWLFFFCRDEQQMLNFIKDETWNRSFNHTVILVWCPLSKWYPLSKVSLSFTIKIKIAHMLSNIGKNVSHYIIQVTGMKYFMRRFEPVPKSGSVPFKEHPPLQFLQIAMNNADRLCVFPGTFSHFLDCNCQLLISIAGVLPCLLSKSFAEGIHNWDRQLLLF